jgi:hypothetical protein
MRIRTLFQPLQVAALLSTVVIAGQTQAADHVERSVHLRYGQPNGFQEVRHNADGDIACILSTTIAAAAPSLTHNIGLLPMARCCRLIPKAWIT